MADRRHRLHRPLTLLSGTFGALLMLFTLAPDALAACEDAKEQASKPGYCAEYDDEGRCTLWFDGQIYLGSGNRLNLPEDEFEPLPPDRFELFALVSPCGGGPPPPHQNAYDCQDFEQLSAACSNDGRYYNVWSRSYEQDEPEWQPATEWEHVQGLCVTTEQGAAHEHLPENEPWITYIASYPGGDLHTDPDSSTLVGFPTNFYTELPTEIRYTAVHNSGPVQMCVEPEQWLWDFGDGERELTDTPGSSYEDGQDPEVTHTYEKRGEFEPSVSVRYSRYLNSGEGWTTNDLLTDSLPGQGTPLEMMQLVPRLIAPPG